MPAEHHSQTLVRPPMLHVVARPTFVTQLFSSLLAICLLIGAVCFGLIVGMVMGIAGSSMDPGVATQTYRAGSGRERIVIIDMNGVIDESAAGFMHKAVNQVLGTSGVKAVVLRVDSPGGGVTASDQIWYEVERLRASGLPVVASYGSVAASGGYYISCSADHIMAERTSITGSIGVIAQVLTIEKLMDKVGITPITLVANNSPQKDIANDIYRSWTEADRTKILTMLDSAYGIFRERVAAGRSTAITSDAALDAAANGSIFTADEAVSLGLVDSIGYLNDAIARAEQLAGMTAGRGTVLRIERPMSLFGFAGLTHRAAAPQDLLNAERLRTLVSELASPRLMYLMP